MSITTEIERIKSNIKNAYTKASEKGATIPTIQNSENLAEAINSINGSEGINPSGELLITENGTYDVINYASALVDISTSNETAKVQTGTFTIAEDCEEYTFSELDFTPDVFLVCAETMGQGYVRTAMWLHSDILKLLLCYKNASSVSVTTVVDNNSYTSIAINSFTIKRYLTNNILAGNYKYIAIKNS